MKSKQTDKFESALKQQELQQYDEIFQEQKTEPQAPHHKPRTIRIVIQRREVERPPPPQFVTKRSWHKELDNLVNPLQMNNGRFSNEEVDYIMGVVRDYQQQHNLTDEQLRDYIELKTLGYSKIWLTITKFIPNRTVDSVYKLIRRKLDSKNRQGYWNKDDEEQLKRLVGEYGRKWRKISEYIHRTPDNIRNKYIQIGEQNHEFRDKNFWSISEFLTLIQRIHEITGFTLLVENYEEILTQSYGEDYQNVKFKLNFRKRKEKDKEVFETLKSILILPETLGKSVKWTAIANEIKTKTKDDLRQMWFKLNDIPY